MNDTEKDQTRCNLFSLVLGDKVYAVSTRDAVYPLAIFQCHHCAEEYANTHLFLQKVFVHELPISVYTQFFCNGIQEIVEMPGV